MRDYIRDLVEQLRRNGVVEDEVVETVREVVTEVERTGRQPTELFGDAEKYADSFPEGNQRHSGYWVGLLGAVVPSVVGLPYIILSIMDKVPHRLPTMLLVYGSLTAFLVACVFASAALYRRLPSQFKHLRVGTKTDPDQQPHGGERHTSEHEQGRRHPQ